jgi:hypothetical protein
LAEKIGLTARQLHTRDVRDWVVETAKPEASDQKGLYHSNLVAAFDYSELRDALVARVANCVTRAFNAIGSSAESQEIIYWNLLMTRNLRRSEIIDRPDDFILVILRREIKREFNLSAMFDKKPIQGKRTSELLHLIAHTAMESQSHP